MNMPKGLHTFFNIDYLRNIDLDEEQSLLFGIFFDDGGPEKDVYIEYHGVMSREVAPNIEQKGTLFKLCDYEGNEKIVFHGPTTLEEFKTSFNVWLDKRD